MQLCGKCTRLGSLRVERAAAGTWCSTEQEASAAITDAF